MTEHRISAIISLLPLLGQQMLSSRPHTPEFGSSTMLPEPRTLIFFRQGQPSRIDSTLSVDSHFAFLMSGFSRCGGLIRCCIIALVLIAWTSVLGCVPDLRTWETKIIAEVAVARNAAEVTTKSSSMDLKCRLTCLFGISTPVVKMPIVSLHLRFLHAAST